MTTIPVHSATVLQGGKGQTAAVRILRLLTNSCHLMLVHQAHHAECHVFVALLLQLAHSMTAHDHLQTCSQEVRSSPLQYAMALMRAQIRRTRMAGGFTPHIAPMPRWCHTKRKT